MVTDMIPANAQFVKPRFAIARLPLVFLAMVTSHTLAETAFFTLDNVVLEEGPQLTGIFSWTYNSGDFENGSGQFITLNVPYSSHDETDLDANIDVTQLIEITLPGSVHDDGVDISLVLATSLTPTTPAPLVLGPGESKYEIGGNGFHTGLFVSGSVSPVIPVLSIVTNSPGSVEISWQPDLPGYALQENSDGASDTWANVLSGTNHPVVVPMTNVTGFYRLMRP